MTKHVFIILPLIWLFIAPGASYAAQAKRPAESPHAALSDVVVADFEGDHYAGGWTATGTAFGNGPAHGTLDRQQPVSGFSGQGLASSYHGDDRAVGTLSSPPFVLRRNYLSFLIGGGSNVAEERIDLLVDGCRVRTAAGADSETLSGMQWDIAAYKGKTAFIRISDTGTGSWGHISVDAITLTDVKIKVVDERTRLLSAAMAAVQAAIPVAEADPRRPAYHFHAPAHWMNDPNGPLYYNGWYHVFYQFNPYGSQWGNMHWGHARSRDLVDWQQMPVALWPSKSKGEDAVFSGSIFPRADGTEMAFYTSIGGRDPQQWGAVSHSPDLAAWTKTPANPLLTTKIHGHIPIVEWRDPFLFSQNHSTFMLTGGGLHGRGVVNLYQATSPALTTWKYLGVLFQHPDVNLSNIECPNLAHIDGKWLLLTSTYGRVESFVGQLDLAKRQFIAEKRGVLADGSYASQLMRTPDGSIIHLAWVHTDQGSGWNGYMTLPSTLHITPDGTVLRRPDTAFTRLRGRHLHLSDQALENTLDLTPQVSAEQISGKSLELVTDIDPGASASVMINLRASTDGTRSIALKYEVASRTLSVPGHAPIVLPLLNSADLTLDIFLDNGALDVYADDGAVTFALFSPDTPATDSGLRLSADGGGAAIKSLDIYEMKPAIFDRAQFK